MLPCTFNPRARHSSSSTLRLLANTATRSATCFSSVHATTAAACTNSWLAVPMLARNRR